MSQPEALRLADELDREYTQGRISNYTGLAAAAELRRQHEEIERLRALKPESDSDPSRCPKCGGEADNGHDRCDPPNPYHCTKCMAQPARQWVDLTDEDKQDLYSNWGVSLAAMHFVSERLKAKNGGTE